MLNPGTVMSTSSVHPAPRGWTRRLQVIGIAAALLAAATAAGAEPATALRTPSGPGLERVRETPFDRPLSVESTEVDNRLEGQIHAVIDHPFTRAKALADPAHWCELLPLLPNRAMAGASNGVTRGRRTVKVLPCPWPLLAAVTMPPCSATSRRTTARPSPRPPGVRSSDGSPW
jgi:hypothetical protein